MKHNPFLALSLFILLYSLPVLAQEHDTIIIRKLDDQERLAILNKDTASLSILMSPGIVVHNPEHSIVGYRQILERIRQGKINYATFERRIEKVTIVNGIAAVMGQETIVPLGETRHAGKTIKRRFTNIWSKEDGLWKLTIRQATIISIE